MYISQLKIEKNIVQLYKCKLNYVFSTNNFRELLYNSFLNIKDSKIKLTYGNINKGVNIVNCLSILSYENDVFLNNINHILSSLRDHDVLILETKKVVYEVYNLLSIVASQLVCGYELDNSFEVYLYNRLLLNRYEPCVSFLSTSFLRSQKNYSFEIEIGNLHNILEYLFPNDQFIFFERNYRDYRYFNDSVNHISIDYIQDVYGNKKLYMKEVKR